MTEVEFVQVTWKHAVRVWWSLLWRLLLFGFLTTAGAGFILAIFAALLKIDAEVVKGACTIFGYIALILAGIVATKLVLNRHYSDFKIALISM